MAAAVAGLTSHDDLFDAFRMSESNVLALAYSDVLGIKGAYEMGYIVLGCSDAS